MAGPRGGRTAPRRTGRALLLGTRLAEQEGGRGQNSRPAEEL